MQGQTLPLARFKAGQIFAAIWENTIIANGKKLAVPKASVHRRYKNKDGEWKNSGSFSRNEIPLVIHCLQQAFKKIIELQNNESNNDTVNEEIVM